MDNKESITSSNSENEKKEKKDGNKIFLLILGVITVIVALIGATFAYFTALINKPGGEQSVELTTTTVQGLVYTAGNPIIIEHAIPGASSSSKFSVMNPNTTVKIIYTINFVPIKDDFVKDAGLNQLTLTVTGGTIKNNSPVVLDYTDGANAKKQPVVTDVSIDAKETHEYNATLRFVETNTNQSVNQDKNFAGYFEVVQSTITTRD